MGNPNAVDFAGMTVICSSLRTGATVPGQIGTALDVADSGGVFAMDSPVTVGENGTGHDVTMYGDTSGKNWMWDQSADSMIVTGVSQFTGAVTVGVDATGHDVIFYGDTTGKKWMWDESADSMIVTGVSQFTGTVTVGVNGTGHDVTMYGDTSGKSWLWDESADKMIVTAASDFLGAVTVGVDGTGHDVIFYGDTSGKNATWDESADAMIFTCNVQLPQAVDNVHDTTPTAASIVTALGAAARGKIGTIDDADGDTNTYLCIATDASWYYLKFTKAT